MVMGVMLAIYGKSESPDTGIVLLTDFHWGSISPRLFKWAAIQKVVTKKITIDGSNMIHHRQLGLHQMNIAKKRVPIAKKNNPKMP